MKEKNDSVFKSTILLNSLCGKEGNPQRIFKKGNLTLASTISRSNSFIYEPEETCFTKKQTGVSTFELFTSHKLSNLDKNLTAFIT